MNLPKFYLVFKLHTIQDIVILVNSFKVVWKSSKKKCGNLIKEDGARAPLLSSYHRHWLSAENRVCSVL